MDGLNLTIRAAALACAVVAQPLAAAQSDSARDYPNKPVRFIVPFAPGAGTDTTARTIAQKLSDAWGQQVVVDNRTGAAGAIGVDLTAKAIPDGYTICLISASHSVNSAVNPKLLRLDNVVLLPHMGSATLEGRIAMGEKVLINIKSFVDGHNPPDRVLATMF